MKAAVFHEPKHPLKIEEVENPQIGPHEILVKISACGVCNTDLHYIDHGVPTFKKPPMILGHEPSGIVEEAGAEVKNFKPGDRVLIPPVFSCGYCDNCRLGRENICFNMVMLGNHIDGAFAEYTKAPAKDCQHLPEELPIQESSIIADAISTPYHAVKNRAQVRPGDSVVVFGCGGVGINVVQVAAATGGSVIAVDILDSKLEMAKKLGAQHIINAADKEDKELLKEIRALTGGGADIAIEAIGNPKTIELSSSCVKAGGLQCQVGYTHHNVPINAGRLMFREIEIKGSLGCRPVDYPKIIEMVKTGKIQLEPVVTHKFKLDEIEQAFDLMRKGESLRSIIVF
ncbi:MAG: zinc-binding dehydrogenase [Candidatus Aminicenantes bacterium]|nr:MAG: zinc-binding dehydrogenase [Candidatus Aminicenantes bacterium]